MGAATRKKVQRKFKIRGYTLKVEALDEILSFLSHFQDAEDEAIDLLLDELENESCISVFTFFFLIYFNSFICVFSLDFPIYFPI